MKKRSFVFFHDPSHGWLRVSFGDLVAVGMKINGISKFSYQKNFHIYLEEDCDVPYFISKWEKKFGIIKIFHQYSKNDSTIRQYERIHP